MKCFPLLSVFLLLLGACTMSVDQQALVGNWDYIRVDNLNPSSEDSTTVADLRDAKPYIQFSKTKELRIYWDDKLLSSGRYTLDGKMIRYTEDLPDGGTREFPFLVSSLSDGKIVFETMSREGTRVTAIKRK